MSQVQSAEIILGYRCEDCDVEIKTADQRQKHEKATGHIVTRTWSSDN